MPSKSVEVLEKPLAVVIGDVNVDIITPPFDPKVLSEGETSCVLDEFTTSLGGNAINMAATLAALQSQHLFIGGLGDCGNSIWIEKKCEELGIQTKFARLPEKSAGITFALTYIGGRRQFVATLGTNKLVEPDQLDLSFLEQASPGLHLHRAGFWYTPRLKGSATIKMFKTVIENGGETSLDVGWDPEGFTEENREILYNTLQYTKYFFGNEKEFLAITNMATIEEAYQELLSISTVIEDPILVVHRGSEGSAIISRNDRQFLPPEPIAEVINPTGSGDVFNGAFIHGLLKKMSYQESAIFAGKIAAIHLQDITKIYPTLEDYQAYCKENN